MARQMYQTRDTCSTAGPREANTRTKPYRDMRAARGGCRDPMEIIGKTRTHKIITMKESYPHNSYTGLAGLARMCHLDETQDGIVTAMHW